jgi:hypothetical protein
MLTLRPAEASSHPFRDASAAKSPPAESPPAPRALPPRPSLLARPRIPCCCRILFPPLLLPRAPLPCSRGACTKGRPSAMSIRRPSPPSPPSPPSRVCHATPRSTRGSKPASPHAAGQHQGTPGGTDPRDWPLGQHQGPAPQADARCSKHQATDDMRHYPVQGRGRHGQREEGRPPQAAPSLGHPTTMASRRSWRCLKQPTTMPMLRM